MWIVIFVVILTILITRGKAMNFLSYILHQIRNTPAPELHRPQGKAARSDFSVFFNGHPNRNRPKNKKLNRFY